MNSEIDLIFGPYLLSLARANNVVYTSCDGDQYGVIKHLIDDLRCWGFDMVMAGNIKGFLDRCANPENIITEACPCSGSPCIWPASVLGFFSFRHTFPSSSG